MFLRAVKSRAAHRIVACHSSIPPQRFWYRNLKLQPSAVFQLRQSRMYNEQFRSRLFHEVRSGGFRRNWISITAFGLLISTAIGATTYYVWLFQELVEKPLAVYPKPVAKEIKAALYYASRNDVPAMATHFKNAITAAEESGMHPLSDEVAGLKIECAALLAKLGNGEFKNKSVDVLEHVLDEAVAGAEYFEKQGRITDRKKVLKRAVLLGYKIGELYHELSQNKSAEDAMVWSTETLLRENNHLGDTSGKAEEVNEQWFDATATAACLEKMADHYERTSQHFLASPLYLRALTLIPTSCHSITLMTNLAAALSQQNPPSDAKISRADLISDAQKWATKALEISGTIAPPERTQECDQACVVATHNLGEMAEMLGDKTTAKRRYEEALSLAKGLGMDEGVLQAQEALARLCL
ncbi:hypothetical protein EDC01DRAFT_640291 [Geopyxis carbonaria]|nr:hypothetical protein EDC01DRAFT_640291 [Geopyxis carbonaria]